MLGPRIGDSLIELQETDSTNNYASRLIHTSLPVDGSVIMAHYQKAGRGQRNSGWESEAGSNLNLSYILYPAFLRADEQFYLNQAISLAVAEMISFYVTKLPVKIKWPNDILAGKYKITGILIENSIRSSKIQYSIIGIGININQVFFENYLPPAGSFKLLERNEYDLKSCLSKLNNCMNKWYTLLKLKNFDKIRSCYLESLFNYNSVAQYEQNNNRFQGIITDVNNEGKLIIKNEQGELLQFMNKEVKFVF